MNWLPLLMTVGVQAAVAADTLHYRVAGKLPHSRSDFTQGLEIREGRLFQGTGHYGSSRLQVFDLESGKLLRERRLPDHLFGEGITVIGEQVVQLTWRNGIGLVYRLEDLEPVASFSLAGEGWGLANDGERLVYSDGSATLRFIDPGTWAVSGDLLVRCNGTPVPYLNELEWTPAGILANVWRTDLLVLIDPDSGEVTGELDLSGLLPMEEREWGTDVLNGIARDADGSLWVTGKNWPWLYRLELLENPAPDPGKLGDTSQKTVECRVNSTPWNPQ